MSVDVQKIVPARSFKINRPDNWSENVVIANTPFKDLVLTAPPIERLVVDNATVDIASGGAIIQTDGVCLSDTNSISPAASRHSIENEITVNWPERMHLSGTWSIGLALRGRANFSHLLLEGLPNGLNTDIFPNGMHPQQLHEEALAPITRELLSILSPTIQPLFIGRVARFSVDKLVYLKGLKHPLNVVDPTIAGFYRAAAMRLGGMGRFGRKIAILRKPGRRGVQNYHEVASLLQGHGYDLVVPEELSLADQIIAFRDATSIVAVHGAALSSMVFCASSDVTVTEIVQRHYLTPAFWFLARGLGFKYSLVQEKEKRDFEQRTKFSDLYVDLDELEYALS